MSGVRALLLTDVVDSTRMSTELGDTAMALVWASHDRLARDLLPVWRGREIDKTDGMLLLFEEVADAVSYALAYHHGLAALPVSLKARAGLHVGPVALRENSKADVARGAKPLELEGLAKPTVSRVMSLARGGQTLLTQEAREALGLTSLRLVSHGHWVMKGLPEPVELFEVADVDSPFSAPADSEKVYRVVRSGGRWLPAKEIPNNLPLPTTSFVGRDRELREIEAHLSGARLLTLLGMGGLGKTRLALQVAAEVMAEFPDGAWFLDLAPVRDPALVLSEVAKTLRVREEPDRPLLESLCAHLKPLRVLLVFDNCENVVDAVASLAGILLAAAPRLKVLVTSREALDFPGEAVLPVRPLGLSSPGASGIEIAQTEAARLFVERAVKAVPHFVLDEVSAPVVAEICRRVDGIPLALELAAARLRVVAPAQLLELLEERFRLLVGQRRSLPRQQTLHAVVQWSYDHLRPDEQQLLMALSVCGGGCHLDAVGALMAPDTPRAALVSGLAHLAEQSMLEVQQGSTHVRYRLLETVRQFALDKLQESGRAADVRDRHATHYLAVAEAHDQEVMRHGEGAASLVQLDLERDNLLGALAWCDRESHEQAGTTGLRLAVALRHYWSARGLVAIGLKATLAALARADARAPDRLHLWALASAAHLVRILGQNEQALMYARTMRDIAQTIGDEHWQTTSALQLGSISRSMGHLDEAQAYLEDALRGAEAQQDMRRIGDVLNEFAAVATLRGRPEDAARLSARVLDIRRRMGHGFNLAVALLNSSDGLLAVGDLAHARELLVEAAELMPRIGSRFLSQDVIDEAAALLARCGTWDSAVRLYAASSVQRRETGLPLSAEDLAQQRSHLSRARLSMGDAGFEAAWGAGVALDHPATLDQALRWLKAASVAGVGDPDPTT